MHSFNHDIGAAVDVRVCDAAAAAAGTPVTATNVIDTWGLADASRRYGSLAIFVSGNETGDAGGEGITFSAITVETSDASDMNGSNDVNLVANQALAEIVAGNGTVQYSRLLATFDMDEVQRYVKVTYTATSTGTASKYAITAVLGWPDKAPALEAAF